jgi:hypothetical protein
MPPVGGMTLPPIPLPPATGNPAAGPPDGNPTVPPGQGFPPAGGTPYPPYPPPYAPPPPGTPPPAVPPAGAPGLPSPSPPAPVPEVPPPTPPPGSTPSAQAAPAPANQAPPRHIRITPRGAEFHEDSTLLPNGEMAYVITGGVIITISNPADGIAVLDMEADRLVIWKKGNLQETLSGMRRPGGTTTREAEFYLAGNVEIRSRGTNEEHTLRADEVYYDVGRNVAVAYQADLEFRQPRLPDPVHMRADELLQVSPNLFKAKRAEIFSSRLPSDPGLKVVVMNANLEQKKVPRRYGPFGRTAVDPKTGQPEIVNERLFWGWNSLIKLDNIPVIYLPYMQGDPRDPLGPLNSINYSYNRLFGNQFFTTWNVYDLFGLTPAPGTRWNLNVDELSKRGPALGTNADYSGNNFFGIPGNYSGYIKAYGLYDKGFDLLGGNRGALAKQPMVRGRFFWHHNEELPDDFYFQGQLSGLSDKNFLEEYYYNEWNTFVNQETFLFLKQQRDVWSWYIMAEPNLRRWTNETERLPELDGYLLGESLPFLGDTLGNRLTYNAHASAGYYRLRTTDQPPPPFGLTTFADNTGRFDLWQDVGLPFYVGPVKMTPFGVVDLTQYTSDLTGSERGRFYGGGGLRASLPLSHLYTGVQNELLNVNGIYHKVVLSGNYYIAHSDTGFTMLPQLDRLNDDATDQSIRDITPIQPFVNPNPANGRFLATSPLFDPQVYAIRRYQDQLFNRVDTLDTMESLVADLRQRLQTKRGYPGMQHTVDWMVLDVSATYFPHPARDNFNSPFGFVTYDYTWNVGDRTALVSTGWVDPIPNGARVFTVGTFLNRPDRTNFYFGYRQFDPIGSRLLTGSASYVFSPKYAMTLSSSYDLGFNSGLSNALIFTRMGTDLQVSLGATYNSILNNFGVIFSIMPNLAAQRGRAAGFGSGMLGR